MPNTERYFYEFDFFRVDPDRRLLTRQKQPVPLQPKAFDVLLALVRAKGQVVSKDDLLKTVWAETFVEESNLPQHVSVLRRTLGEAKDENRYIVTEHGRGYRFAAPVRVVSQEEIAAEENAARSAAKGRVIEIPKPRPIVVQPAAGPEPVPIAGERPRRGWAVWAAFALVVVLAVALAVRHVVVPPGPPPVVAEKRIAVLPLAIVEGDDQTRALADGLVETITSKLSQIQSFQGKLMVVPASEIRARHIASAEAARRIYGANLVITGSAQRWSDRLQFTLNLVDTATVRQLDSRTFELAAANPINLRDHLTSGAIEMLALRLTPEARNSIIEGETSVPAAYAEYLKGEGYLARYDVSGNIDRAIDSLTEATRLDSRYALAFAALGRARWLKAKAKNDLEEKQKAIDTILESIRLAPRLADGHVSLGEIYSQTGRGPEAIQEERSALRLAPGNAQAYTVLGDAYSSSGQYDQAEAVYQEAIRRQPNDWYGYLMLGLFYVNRGRNKDARSAYESALKLTPNNEMIYRNLAVLEMGEGRFREASDMIAKTLDFEPNRRTYMTLGAAYYYQRRYSEAASAFHSGIALSPDLYSLWGDLAEVYRHIPGDEDKAREAFRKAIELAEKRLATVQSDDNTRANLAQYRASLGQHDKALAEIAKIPESSRLQYADRIIPAYELVGDRRRAVEMVLKLPPSSPSLIFIGNHPDLESLWRDPALQQNR